MGGIIIVLAFALLLIVPRVKPGTIAKGHETVDDNKPSLTLKNVVTVSQGCTVLIEKSFRTIIKRQSTVQVSLQSSVYLVFQFEFTFFG